MKKISIIIPVFNECSTINKIVEKILSVSIGELEKEIIIVDDASTDGSREILKGIIDAKKHHNIKVIFKDFNQGKGAAIKTALKHTTGDIVLVQDADLEYDPQDYPNLLQPILSGMADVVYGTRFFGSGPHRVLFFRHYIGNRILTTFANLITNLNLSDMEVGYKLFRKEVFDGITIKSQRFGFEPEITLKLARKNFRFYEVPISYHGRTYSEGKKITWKDGLAALYFLVRFWIKD